MYEQFKLRAEGVGAEVHRCMGARGAGALLTDILRREGVTPAAGRTAVCAVDNTLPPGIAVRLQQDLPGLTTDVNRQTAAAALVGITGMAWGLADTGTLVADQSAVAQRLASSLPEIHVALVATEAILPGKAELFRRIDPLASPYIAFITGPSRTADIERVLTIGVHGPKQLVIICIDSIEGGAL
jgi:L-lactate dehydrogenase complex protein LldG